MGMSSCSTTLTDRAPNELFTRGVASFMKSLSLTPCGIGRALAGRRGTCHSSVTQKAGMSCRMSSSALMDLPLPFGAAPAFRTGQSALECPILRHVQHGLWSRGTSGCGHLSSGWTLPHLAHLRGARSAFACGGRRPPLRLAMMAASMSLITGTSGTVGACCPSPRYWLRAATSALTSGAAAAASP